MTTQIKLPDEARTPRPVGYQLLVVPYEPERKTKGGIIIPDKTVDAERMASQSGYVWFMGSDAYTDSNKFPTGPWCKIGDWIMLSKWGGKRFTVDGIDLRIINDDEVLAVVPVPEALYTLVGLPTFEK